METKTVINLAASIDYAPDGIVSKEFAKNTHGGITLFSFDKGQRLSEHTAPFDAVVHVIEGTAEITIDGEVFNVDAGNVIIMPGGHPHAVNAQERFKMLLIMIRC